MLTKLANWWKALTKDLSKNEMERFLEGSADIHELESRIHYWERHSRTMWPDARYY